MLLVFNGPKCWGLCPGKWPNANRLKLEILFSIVVIWVLTGVLLYMAIWRIIQHEYDVEPDTVTFGKE